VSRSNGRTIDCQRVNSIWCQTQEKDATSIVLCHNHPSGNVKPSRADEELTYKIKEAAKYFDIKVIDHIIVSEEGYYSFS